MRTDGDRRDEPATTTPWLVNNILFGYEGDKHTENESERKQHFLQHKKKHSSTKEAYTDGSKSTGKKVGYAAIFTDTTRRGALLEEASIYTAEITAMKEIKEREEIRWVIYKDSLSSMLAIENNRENHPILNQIYDILTDLHNKKNSSCYVKSLHTYELKETKKQTSSKTDNRYTRDDHNKTTLFRLLPDN